MKHNIFIYDLSCLISQQVAETASGTTRVDLRYADYFLREHADVTMFVKQHGNKLLLIGHDRAAALIRHLQLNWENGTVNAADHAEDNESNLEFRMKHHGLWDPDLETFFSMSFMDRFNFLLKQELTEIFGVEFRWVRRLPNILRITYALLASLSRYPAKFLLRTGQFIGIYLHTRSIRQAVNFIRTKAGPSQFLTDKIRELSTDTSTCHYIYTAYNRGFPFTALEELKRITEIKYTVFIHDLILINYPEYFLPVNHRDQINWMRHLLKLKPRLIANSDVTRSCIERFSHEHQRHAESIITAHIGVEPCFLDPGPAPESPDPVQKTYFVVISTIEPRKNHLLLLNIWRELAGTHRLEPMPELYLVGRRGWENENIIDMVERCIPLQGIVHETANLSDTGLMQLLKGARALLYPSFCEGWGMPVVEALTLGVPVICSDIPELRESGQNIPEYLHPVDGIGWTRTIVDFCAADSPLRNAQLHRMQQFVAPTWDMHFRQISQQYLEPDS